MTGVLHPVLGPQYKRGVDELEHLAEGHQYGCVLWEDTEGHGFVQPEKRSLWEDLIAACQYLQGEKDRARLLADVHSRLMRHSENEMKRRNSEQV